MLIYDEWSSSPARKAVYLWADKNRRGEIITIQELDDLGFSRPEIEDVLSYFESRGAFDFVQHLGETHPVLFRFET